MHQERNPLTVSQLIDSGITGQRNLCQMPKNFAILNQEAALEQSTFPIRPLLVWVPELCRTAILDCRVIHKMVRVLQERFWTTTCSRRIIFHNSKNLASSPQEFRFDTVETARKRDSEMKRESLKTSVPSPHFQRWSGMLDHVGGTYSHNGMMDHRRIPVTGWNLGKISWRFGISKLESQLQNWGLSESSRSSDHHALDQRSWDCKISWRTYDIAIDSGERFSCHRCAWCDDCVSLEKLLNTQSHFRVRVSVEEQRAQKTRPILTRWTDCAHDLRVIPCKTGAYEAVQGLSTLFEKSTSDGIMLHYLWVKCPQTWSWKDLQVKIGEFCSTSDCGFVWSRNGAKQGAELLTIEDSCKTSYWSFDETSKFQSMERRCGKGISHQESKRKPTLRKVGECFQWQAHDHLIPEETHVVSVMTQRSLEPVAKVRNDKDDRLLLHPTPRQNRLTARNKNPHRDQAANRKTRWIRVKFLADSNSLKIRHVNSGILPNVWITSLKKDVYMVMNAISDMLRPKESPTKGQRKVVQKDQLPCRRSLDNWVVCLKILIRENFVLRERERKVPSRGIIQKWSPHERCPCAPRSHEKKTWGVLSPRKMRPRSSVGFGEKYLQAQESRQNYVLYTPIEKKGCRHLLQRDQRSANLLLIQEHQCTWWAKKIFAQERDGHSKKVQNPHRSVDCKRRGANPRGGTCVRSWSQSLRDIATARWNARSPIAEKALRRPRIPQWVGQPSKSHDWPKTGKPSSAKLIISYFSSFQGYPPILQAVRFQHRYTGLVEKKRRKEQPGASSSSSSSVSERSDELATTLVPFPEIQKTK